MMVPKEILETYINFGILLTAPQNTPRQVTKWLRRELIIGFTKGRSRTHVPVTPQQSLHPTALLRELYTNGKHKKPQDLLVTR